ncbi:MAG: tetratricopeptide repeat protein [Hyphomicrobiales bacterium]|nr:tetratricopeptide repeat protein [Hyphomicrobiales bacterium]
MWRILLFLLVTLALAFLCIFLVEQHGLVSLSLGSRVYETSLPVVILALIAAAVALYFGIRLLLFLFRLPFATFALSRARRDAKGRTAISKGLVAVASGDLHAASRHAQSAERFAGHEPLALLLKAQTAQLNGNRAAAKEAFARMSEIADTRGLGLRGLFVEARRRGDHVDAHRHAAKAAALDVFLPWAHEATLTAQCHARDWMAALATLERNHRLGAMETGDMRRAKAALMAARGLDLRDSQPKEALHAALKALKIDPGLTPAAVTAASVLVEEGRQRRAARIIEAAWQKMPHPDLAEAYLSLGPAASAMERAKHIAKLTRLTPDHEEARVALGRALLAARQFAEARQGLAPLAESRPTARVCLLMAEIEEAEHGMTGLAREWLARAAHAPRDPAWIADGTSFPHWAPFAPESGRIGAFVWEHPPEWVEALPGPSKALVRIEPPPAASLPSASQATASALAPLPGPEAAETKELPIPASIETGARNGGNEPESRPVAEEGAKDSPQTSPSFEADGIVVEGRDGETKPSGTEANRVDEAATPRNDTKQANDALAAASSARRIEPVAFALDHAPDDPGTGPPDTKGPWRRLTE